MSSPNPALSSSSAPSTPFPNSRLPYLAHLLTHKINLTLARATPTVPALNKEIRDLIEEIKKERLFQDPGVGKEFHETWGRLEGEVQGWGEEGGTTMDERAKLANVMQELLGMAGVPRGGWEGGLMFDGGWGF